MNTIGIVLAAAIHWLFKTPLHFTPDTIILLTGLLTLAGTIAILYFLPDYFVRLILWLFTHTVYRIKIVGAENLPLSGPALLVSNHVSFVDAFMIGGALPRLVRFMLHRDYYDLKFLNWFFRLMHSIPVSATNRRDIVQSLKHARNELDKGHVVCIFAEGAISRDRSLAAVQTRLRKNRRRHEYSRLCRFIWTNFGAASSVSRTGDFSGNGRSSCPIPSPSRSARRFAPMQPCRKCAMPSLELESNAFEPSRQRRRFASHQIYSNGETTLVFLLHGRHHRHRAELRQDPDRQPAAIALDAKTLRGSSRWWE